MKPFGQIAYEAWYKALDAGSGPNRPPRPFLHLIQWGRMDAEEQEAWGQAAAAVLNEADRRDHTP